MFNPLSIETADQPAEAGEAARALSSADCVIGRLVCTLTGELERDEYVSWSLARGTVALARAAAADLLHCKHFAHLTTSTRKKSPAVRKRRVGGEVCGEPNGVSRVVMGEDQRGARPMLKAPMLLAAVPVVCVASSADARRRHHYGYYGYGERTQSGFDDWRRARAAHDRDKDPQQIHDQNSQQSHDQDPQQGRDPDSQQNRAQDPGQPRGQDRAQDQNSGQDRTRDSHDRRRARYDDWRRARDERRDWRRSRDEDTRRAREREDWTRRREAERSNAELRRGRGPFGAVVEKLIRGCGQQGADFGNWPFDALARIAGADEGQRTALTALRDSAKKAAERLAADCPEDVPAAPSARLEAVEQGIDAMLAAFDMVEPALQSFYGALDDEQKARLYRDMMAAPAAGNAAETTGRRDTREDARQANSSRRHRSRAAYASAGRAGAERAAAARDTSGPGRSAMCEELATVLRSWPVREIERDVRLSSAQRVAFYELVTSSLKAADTLGGACPGETALTPVGRMEAMRQRLSAVRAATAAIRPALAHFYEALDQGQKLRFAGMS